MSDVNEMHNNVNSFLAKMREILNEHEISMSGDIELYCSRLGFLGNLEDDGASLEVVIGDDAVYSSN